MKPWPSIVLFFLCGGIIGYFGPAFLDPSGKLGDSPEGVFETDMNLAGTTQGLNNDDVKTLSSENKSPASIEALYVPKDTLVRRVSLLREVNDKVSLSGALLFDDFLGINETLREKINRELDLLKRQLDDFAVRNVSEIEPEDSRHEYDSHNEYNRYNGFRFPPLPASEATRLQKRLYDLVANALDSQRAGLFMEFLKAASEASPLLRGLGGNGLEVYFSVRESSTPDAAPRSHYLEYVIDRDGKVIDGPKAGLTPVGQSLPRRYDKIFDISTN